MKKLILGMFVVILLGAGALAVVIATRPAPGPPAALEQPAPEAADERPPPRVSPAVFLALVCVFNLSLVALLGSIALRRRIDRISPDR